MEYINLGLVFGVILILAFVVISALRISALESKINNMPEFKNMEKLHSDIHKVDNKVSQINGRLEGFAIKLNMIDQHLMNKDK